MACQSAISSKLEKVSLEKSKLPDISKRVINALDFNQYIQPGGYWPDSYIVNSPKQLVNYYLKRYHFNLIHPLSWYEFMGNH